MLIKAKNIIFLTLALGLMFQTPISAIAKTPADKYVRTANYFLMSGRTLEDSATIDMLTKFDLLVLPAEAQVWNKTFFVEARKRNPNIIILAYVPSVSWNSIWKDSLHQELLTGIKNDFWLTDGAGNKKSIWPGTSALNLNSDWAEYLADFANNKILSSGLWNGIFFDEVGETITWVGSVDVDQNGTSDDNARADELWRAGFVRLLKRTRELAGPSKIIITNGSSHPNYQPYVNGRMFETFPTPWEGDGKWQTVMNNYLRLEKEVKGAPPIFIVNGNTSNTGNQSDYKKVRFGLASTLLGGGYFGFDFGDKSHAQTWYYDEYDASLGKPTDPPKDALKNGSETTGAILRESVWERNFAQGKVLVNPTNSAQEVRLDGEYEKLHGKQDPATNNGGIVSRITLPAKDGIILLRPVEQIYDATFINGSFVRVFNSSGSTKRTGFFAFDTAQKGSARVVRTDIDFDGKRETIAAGDSEVRIYDDDDSLHASFFPYTSAYKLGVNIAIADIEGNGSVEIVTGTENGGGPQMRIFNKDGALIHPGFFGYDTAFRGGVNVALGDLDGDGVKEIIAGAGVGGGPHVRVFNKDGKLSTQFFAFDKSGNRGVEIAASDLDSNGIDEIIAMSSDVFTFSFR